jgi:hypothetical protein
LWQYLAAGQFHVIGNFVGEGTQHAHDASGVEGTDVQAAGVTDQVTAQDNAVGALDNDHVTVHADGDRLQGDGQADGAVVDQNFLRLKQFNKNSSE